MKNSVVQETKPIVAGYVQKHQQQLQYKANILNGDITAHLGKETVQQVGVGKQQQNSSVQNFNPQVNLNNNKPESNNANKNSDAPIPPKDEVGRKQQKPLTNRIRSASSSKALISQQSNSKGMIQVKDENVKQQINQVSSKERITTNNGFERQLSSQNNGMGLWVHGGNKPNVSNYSQQNENLPPISNKRASQQQFNKQQSTPVAKSLLSDIDSKVEKSLVQILEQKYQEAAQAHDRAELLKEKAQFECDLAKKEKQKYLDLYNQTVFDLTSLRQKHEDLEQKHQENSTRVQQMNFENQKLVQQIDMLSKNSESYQKLYQQEQRARENEAIQNQNKIRELEDQLGEYEEEHMNLQNQLYQQKNQIEILMKNQGGMANASQMDISQISKSGQKKPVQAKDDFEDCFGSGEDNIENQNRQNVNQPSNIEDDGLDDKTKKIQELIQDMIQMRKRLKKEEESRRQYQDIARKKEDEIKKMKQDLNQVERKLQEEEGLKNREKNLVMQRDNKIKVLEDKIKQIGQEPQFQSNDGAAQKKQDKVQQQKAKNMMKYKGQIEPKEDKIVKMKDSDKLLMMENNNKNDNVPQNNKNKSKQVKFAANQMSDGDSSEEEKVNNNQTELKPVKARLFLFGPVDDM
ncbi:UNKNOWN [Stylonychia lemnae]|uniref:Uncharacterized protein n=1 Tax=Stylonychia lemnae TaxID=5949 RepID=A0A077ZWR9_STYLE|nr:UNKNOWN [Stylonychia lemnae]|eukprot:CDW74041.1 UNKNOWN [Stylonychia lemnae]